MGLPSLMTVAHQPGLPEHAEMLRHRRLRDSGLRRQRSHCLFALAAKALDSKSASEKRREFNPATAKYDMRVLLLGLGFIGDEFASTRLHLTKHLAGSAAWKRGRPDRAHAEAHAA